MRQLLILALFVCHYSLFAMSRQSSQKTAADQNQTIVVEEDPSEEDLWYGPGFYYGIWFEDEDDYWQWRQNHRGYPPNHRYYDPHHPVYYHYSGDGHHPEEHSRGDDGR